MIRKIFVFYFICLLFMPVALSAKEAFTVVIDAGHGGGDVGTPHRKGRMDEKTIALNVALKLGNLIKENHTDVRIVYTRTSDVYPTLPERTQIARKAKGDLFISIHVNGAENTAARGFETYVFGITGLAGKSADEQKRIRQRTMMERENLDINGKQIDFEKTVDIQTKILCQTQREKHNIYSKEFAELVQNSMIAALKRSSYRGNVNDRGVKEKNIYVLCYSPMPAILVEMGYMSNVTEEKFLNTLEAQNLFATSLYDAFATYKQNWEKRQLDYQGDDTNTSVETVGTTSEGSNSSEAPLKDVKLVRKEEEPKEAESAKKAKSEAEKIAAEEARKLDEARKAAEAKKAEEARLAAEAKKAEEARIAAEAKKAEEARIAAEAKKAEEARIAAEAKKAEEARLAAEAKKAEEARIAAEAKKAEEARIAAEAKKAEEARLAAEAKKAEEARIAAEAKKTAATTAAAAAADTSKPYYRIQFYVSTKKLEKDAPQLKGVWPFDCYEDGGSFKYTVGNSTDRSTLQAKYKEIKALFPDAFWVKFDSNGKRIK